MGQANALPWQTYAVVIEVALIEIFGTAFGLAIWIAGLEFLAGCSCIAMLRAFGVTEWPARLAAALFYALSPVVFTRIAAGHLAYLFAYALMPLAIALARRTIESPRATPAVALGIVIGLTGCQIQFLAIAWLAVLPLAVVVVRAVGWWRRLLVAAGISVAIQLQALLPLAFGSTAALYAGQPALLSFEYNNSSPFASAPVMLGYFTRYYESHALAGAFWVLYALLGIALVLALVVNRNPGIYALTLVAIGTILTAGLYGPLSPALGWAFERLPYVAVFRDLHYFAVLTAIGIALALGLGLKKVPFVYSVPAFALVGWIVAPLLVGGELGELLVSPALVGDALADMQVAAANGPGRVLWLPAEEPIGPRGSNHQGRDFAAYGPASNPSVSDDYQNPQLAYALATLRSGNPDWKALATINVRYLVFRNYALSGRRLNFGTGFQMAFEGLGDAELGRFLSHAPPLTLLARTALSSVYEFKSNAGATYVAQANPDALRYSRLKAREVAIVDSSQELHLPTSPESADPRTGWVEGRLGWRYAPWLPDSIYPFVWTLSPLPLRFETQQSQRCVLAGALPHGARLQLGARALRVRGAWNRYSIADGSAPEVSTFDPHRGDISAVSARCSPSPAPMRRSVFVFASGYDRGWRAVDGGRLIAPEEANGWMMAWDAPVASPRFIYIPALLQLIGFLTAITLLAIALPLARRRDRSG
jgi:hypothetical protein